MSDSNPTPMSRIEDAESKTLFINFCTLINILSNKKVNLANIFLLLLKEKKILELYLKVCEFDHEFEGLKYFLEYDSSIHKSKYVKKYLNSICRRRGTKKLKK